MRGGRVVVKERRERDENKNINPCSIDSIKDRYTFNRNVQVPDKGTVGTPDLVAVSNQS